MKIFALTILIVCIHATSAAMPGLGVTESWPVPVEAYLADAVFEDCNSTTNGGKTTWTFLPATMDGCKDACKEKYPDVSAAELTMDNDNGITASKCCCLGLTEAQSKMTWCTAPNSGSQSYYWLTCATMEEPRPCNVPDSFTTAETLVAYTNGTRDCKAAGDGAPSPAALDGGETAVSSTAASLFFTLLISFFAMQI